MHIQSALAGVAEADRCAGWETGKCPEAPAGQQAGSTVGNCNVG